MTEDEFFISAISNEPEFRGQTLILPAISIGSVPQLALDLLIHAPTLACRRVGYLDGSQCVPFISPPEPSLPAHEVFTALDVYESSKGLPLVQQRSPVIKASRALFTRRLMHWIQEAGFSDVLIISSMDAAMRVDTEFSTPILYKRPSEAQITHLSSAISQLYPPFQPPAYNGPGIPPMPGSGITRMYLEHAPKCTTALIMFCSEGDNREDAHELVRHISAICHLGLQRCTEPPSWTFMYGSAPADLLYG